MTSPFKVILASSLLLAVNGCSSATLRGHNDSKGEGSQTNSGGVDNKNLAQQTGGTPAPLSTGPNDTAPKSDLKLSRICGVNLAVWQKQEYLDEVAAGAIVKLKDTSSGKVTFLDQDPQGTKKMILDQGEVSFAVPAGKYMIDICDPSSAACKDTTKFGDYSGSYIIANNAQIDVPISLANSPYMQIWAKKKWEGKGPECDESTPLMIDLENSKIDLSSQVDGVRFDIDASGHKSQISWPLHASSMFLVLDKKGNGVIDSADQLFGDHSTGPDAKTSENGFLALQKYDDNHDGVIDEKDPIFDKLRLWSDVNRDGKSQTNELFTLKQKGIKAIHLQYKNIYKRDQWFNEFRQKAVIILDNGSTRPIYDVYFKK